MKPIESFTTERTKARRITPGDIDDLSSFYQNPEVMKTLGGVKTRAETLEFLDKMIKHFDTYGYGYWIIEERQTNAFMGRAGLRQVTINGIDEVELGYALLPEYWGKGIATEIGTELVRIGCQELGLSSIVCFTLPENKASQRVMEKCGFRFEKEFVYKGLDHVLFRLVCDQWQE